MAIAKNNINENANGVNLKVGIFGRGGWLAAKIGQNKLLYKMLAYPLKVRDLRYRYADGKLTRQIKSKYYSAAAPRKEGLAEFCLAQIDTNLFGLCDRLNGAVTVYNWSKAVGKDFKLLFTKPFDLRNYLVPNEVDWSVNKEDIAVNPKDAKIVFRGWINQSKTSFHPRFPKNKKQLHIITNAHWPHATFDDTFSHAFHQLFKPSPELEEKLDYFAKEIGGKYVSVSFRFVNLLGDFHDEVKWEVLSSDRREALIVKSLDVVRQVSAENPGMKVLVTADSTTFLERASQLPGVYVIPGNVCHIAVADDTTPDDAHMKTFLDLMMISRAEKVYLGKGEGMFNSSFSRTGAMIGGKPFEIIEY